MGFSKQELEEFYREHAWNEGRLRRSFANKQELTLLSDFVKDVETEGLWFEVSFDQIHEDAYGFGVHICVELAPKKGKFLLWLFKEGNRRPLHQPVEAPIKYGFTAQANQLLIPFLIHKCIQKSAHNPWPRDYRCDRRVVFFQRLQRQCQMILKRVKAFEDPVMEELLAQLVPHMLYGVEFRRVGRQTE